VTLYGQWTGSCSDGLPLTSIVYLLIIVYVQWAVCCSWWHNEFEFCLGVFGVFSCFVLGVVHRWCLIDAINVVKNTDIRPLVYAVGAVCVICILQRKRAPKARLCHILRETIIGRITFCGILWCGGGTGGATLGGLDRPRRARVAAETIADRQLAAN